MDTLTLLMNGFATALTAEALLFCFIGVTIGMLIGVLPGIGPLATISMLLSGRPVHGLRAWRACAAAPDEPAA